MLSEQEERALTRVRVLRAASYRCSVCGVLASGVGEKAPGVAVALCPRHVAGGRTTRDGGL